MARGAPTARFSFAGRVRRTLHAWQAAEPRCRRLHSTLSAANRRTAGRNSCRTASACLFWASDNANSEKDAVRLGSLGSDSEQDRDRECEQRALFLRPFAVHGQSAARSACSTLRYDRSVLTGTASSLASNPWRGMEVSLLPISSDECGDLVYLEPPSNWLTEIGSFDRSGARRGTLGDPGPWSGGRLPPDGHVAIAPLNDLKSSAMNRSVDDRSRKRRALAFHLR